MAICARWAKPGRPIGILVDLQGPKIRLGTLRRRHARRLQNGEKLQLVRKARRQCRRHPHSPCRDFRRAQAGQALLIDDGKIRLQVDAEQADIAPKPMVEAGGVLKDNKGVNLPDTRAADPGDDAQGPQRSRCRAASGRGLDRALLRAAARRCRRIEKDRRRPRRRASPRSRSPRRSNGWPTSSTSADALMVARGDLGVELPMQEVPGKQKYITRAARKAGKPVVVATQMLESMITAPVPTRAEVSDVATAVFEGADAVMLSAESAAGQYPVEAVSMMDKIATTVEGDPLYVSIIDSQRNRAGSHHRRRHHGRGARGDADHPRPRHRLLDQIRLHRAARFARTLRRADHRADAEAGDFAAAVAGLGPALHLHRKTPGSRRHGGPRRALRLPEGFAKPGERIVVTAGVPLRTPGATNMLRVACSAEIVSGTSSVATPLPLDGAQVTKRPSR